MPRTHYCKTESIKYFVQWKYLSRKWHHFSLFILILVHPSQTFLEGNAAIIKGLERNWDCRPMVTDIHKGQHFIHQPIYMLSHQSRCAFLYCSIHQHFKTMSSLLCSSDAAAVMADYNKTRRTLSKPNDKFRNATVAQSPKAKVNN